MMGWAKGVWLLIENWEFERMVQLTTSAAQDVVSAERRMFMRVWVNVRGSIRTY